MATSFRAILGQKLDFWTKIRKNSDVENFFIFCLFDFRGLNKVFVGCKQVPAGFNTFVFRLKRFAPAKTGPGRLK